MVALTHSGWLQEGIIRSSMLGRTMLPSDEELGKKDDDHRFPPPRRSGWPIWSHVSRWRRRRVVLAVVWVCVMCLFWKGAGHTFGALNERRKYPLGRPLSQSTTYEKPGDDTEDDEPQGAPPGTPRPTHGEVSHTYDGTIRFFHLASTLRPAASRTSGYDKENRNILFAISSLTSAATLLPIICDMSTWKRNFVHAAFMGREAISLKLLLEINGVDSVKCPAIWHDARPDYTEYSSDVRAEAAVVGATNHLNTFLHPQVVIIDDARSEDVFCIRGVRNKTTKLGIPLIEIPKDRSEDFTWITRLDAGSLRNWYTPTVNILIQVPPDSSSVLRLLNSIKEADYSGLTPPQITLDLPAELDEQVKLHLRSFKWPPYMKNHRTRGGLTIRRRIRNSRTSQEDSTIRFLELFYPISTTHSHVLLLSPQVQLSPQYYHFVLYALLEYKYSTFGEDDNANLMGISLEIPPTLLDGKSKLSLPTVRDMDTDRYQKLYPTTESAPFLWQAPNSHAALYFGDKWAELHSFLGDRVVQHQKATKTTTPAKLVSEIFPAWTEYMLELIRARGYSLLYPATTSTALVIVHNELYHAPEEFVAPSLQRADKLVDTTLDEPFLRADNPPLRRSQNREPPVIPKSTPLHVALPFNGDLPELPHLPYLLYNGTRTPLADVAGIAKDFAGKFRVDTGGCSMAKGKHRRLRRGQTSDLFCFGDEDESDWEDDTPDKVAAETSINRSERNVTTEDIS